MPIETPHAWEVYICDPRGYRTMFVNTWSSLNVYKVANDVGGFTLVLPGTFDKKYINIDNMIEFWRTPADGRPRLVNVGFIRRVSYADSDGKDVLTLSGPDVMDLLKRRIVAYAAASAEAAISNDPADDTIKAIVRQNLGASATDTTRDLTSYGLTVDVDKTLGDNITKNFAWRNVLEVCREIAETSTYSGIPLYFDIVPLTDNQGWNLEFRTYSGQPGMDRTTGGNIITFGREWGNMLAPSLTYDYYDVVNYVYAGGDGEESARQIDQVQDTSSVALSPWNRCEAFADARNQASAVGVTDIGNAMLHEKRPKITFTGEMIDAPGSRYGVDWNYGDKVFVSYMGRQYAARVLGISFDVNSNGEELLRAHYVVDMTDSDITPGTL